MNSDTTAISNTPILDADLVHGLEQAQESGILGYRTEALPIWCPGCGYYGITHAMLQALNALQIENRNLVVVSGIGCAGRYPFFIRGYGFHAVHGRALPVASGVKMASPDLTVVAVGGDGDGLAIGGGHLPHAIRRNVDITYILFDNGIYGLTKGQSSPTTPRGQVSGTHPYGNPDTPLNPSMIGLTYGALFVARGYAGEPKSLSGIIHQALGHRGFSFVHVVSPCVTFDRVNILYDRLRDLWTPVPEAHDRSDLKSAIALVMDDDFSHGILFEADRPTWDDAERETAERAAGGPK